MRNLKIGGDDRSRTGHLLHAKQTLYQLSYIPDLMLMERATGIEPASAAWEAAVLPLNYAREIGIHMNPKTGSLYTICQIATNKVC